jgi:NADH-quinone oxidoreductase subunit L
MNGSLHLWLIPLLPFAGFLINGILGSRLPKWLVTTVALLAPLAHSAGAGCAPFNFSAGAAGLRRARSFPVALPYVEKPSPPGSTSAHCTSTSASSSTSSRWSCCWSSPASASSSTSTPSATWHDEEGYARYFSYLNLFLFFMTVLVLAGNALLMFVGWEGVGLASYLLIGFFPEEIRGDAGKKAFIVNRIGDFGFLIGMFLLLANFGTLTFSEIAASSARIPAGQGGVLTVIALCLLLGATGKSAQLPLYIWLPDAMEGPTPVSALIHAATMVTAGVYMIARTHVLFDHSPFALACRHRRRGHGALRRHHRPGAERHQARARLLHHLAARLHVPGLRRRGLLGGHLPPRDARLLQGAALPRRRLGDSRHGRRAGPAQDGRPAQEAARHLLDHDRGRLRHRRISALRRLLLQGRDPLRRISSRARGKVLWFVGLVTALLTAFYMFRLWYLTFWANRAARDAASA